MDTLEWGKATGGWQLSVSLDKDSILWSQPVFATIVLKNVSDEKQSVNQTSRWSTEFHLEDEDGPVARTRYGMAARGAAAEAPYAPSVLAPGETITWEIPISRVFDLSEGGPYRLRVSRNMHAGKPPAAVVVPSNEIEFEIAEE